METYSTKTFLLFFLCSMFTVPQLLAQEEQTIPSPKDQNYKDPFAGEIIFVAGGSFDMGADRFGKQTKPIHTVTVPDFYIGKYEVTQAQWKALMGNNPSRNAGCDLCPVERVSWEDAQLFIQKLNEKSSYTYRLPTEAEWEYAAGGGSIDRTNWAGTNDETQIYRYGNMCDKQCIFRGNDKNQDDGFTESAPVGSFLSNRLGIYDMIGNVSEWCEDWYNNSYEGAPTDGSAWRSSPEGSYRVFRGGSWRSTYPSQYLHISHRSGNPPVFRLFVTGFRLARTP